VGDKLFGRVCHVTIGARKFTSPPFTIEFESEFATSGKPNLSTVRLFNPSPETINAASVKTDSNGRRVPPLPVILVDAGYGLNIGQVIVGEAFSSTVKRTKPDIVLEIKVADATQKWREAYVSKTFAKFSTAREILYDLLSDVGITPYSVRLGENKTFADAVSFNETLSHAITRICKETQSKFYFRQGRMLIEPIGSPDRVNLVLLNAKSGLLGSPEKTEKGYKFQSLFNYKLGAGDTVAVEARDVQGYFRIFKGKHSHGQTTAITEFEAQDVTL